MLSFLLWWAVPPWGSRLLFPRTHVGKCLKGYSPGSARAELRLDQRCIIFPVPTSSLLTVTYAGLFHLCHMDEYEMTFNVFLHSNEFDHVLCVCLLGTYVFPFVTCQIKMFTTLCIELLFSPSLSFRDFYVPDTNLLLTHVLKTSTLWLVFSLRPLFLLPCGSLSL